MKKMSSVAATLAIAIAGSLMSFSASAFTATQDGVGINVSYSLSGQTASFHFQADFTGAVTNNWIGSYMDQIGLQFGDANNSGPSIISTYTATLNYVALPNSAGETNATGVWTGFTDKAGGSAPCLVTSLADSICYQLNPGEAVAVGDQMIAAAIYNWYFDVTFKDTDDKGKPIDVAAILGSPRSIKMTALRANFDGNKCSGGPTSPDFSDPGCWQNGGQFSQDGTFTGGDDNDDDNDVPEPGTLALLGLGLMGLGLSRRRRI